jgi:hypothetical protein
MKLTHAVLVEIILLGCCFTSTFSQVELWGVTTEGGVYDHGCIFKTDENGENQEIVYSFMGKTGSYPQNIRLCTEENGSLYGILEDEKSSRSFF